MKISAFESILTYRSLIDKLNFMKAYAEEQGIEFSKLLTIDEYKDINLIYYLSSVRNDILIQNFFTYTRGSLKGLYALRSGTKDLYKVTEPIYLDFKYLHNRAWLCEKPDASFDLYINEQLVRDDIANYDILDLCGYVHFIQLDFIDSRGLICCDGFDANRGIFLPKSKEDFTQYFNSLLFSRGYEGKFDELTLSELLQVYYEVCNCIFESTTFKPI